MFWPVMRAALLSMLVLFGCKKAEETAPKVVEAKGSAATGPQQLKTEQVAPPFDLKNPPADAVKLPSGLVYKKLATVADAPTPRRNDTVMITFTGWKPATGETFFTNTSRGKPMPLNLSQAAKGFVEGLQLVKKGEKAMLWVPAELGYREPAVNGAPPQEPRVYLVEVADITPAPAIPPDVAKPPDNAQTTKSGAKFVAVHSGTGKDKIKQLDTVSFHYTAWDADGRMIETTEMKKQPNRAAPFKQPVALEEVLTQMTAGERIRYWVAASKMLQDGKVPGGAPNGQLCYEIETLTIDKGPEAPPVPPDVAKPPGDAQKTAKGVFYKVLKAGAGGPHPKPTESVKANYSGWTTDGRIFDTSLLHGGPTQFSLQGVIAGWTDAIPLMSIGDKYRLWIPEQLAYKGQPGQPQGMLVFDVELTEITAAPPGGAPPPPPRRHGPPGMPPGGPPGMPPGGPPGMPPHP
jgi:FKBP-type peptidyl-prolyl cis-trans isomerase